ncbi:MAG: hypothetical protein ACR2N4_01085 [Jatrophihabitans sp.]
MKKLAVTGIVLSAATAAMVGLAPTAQAQPPGHLVAIYNSQAACVAAGDYGVAHRQWSDYVCTTFGVPASERALWVEN